MELYDDYEASGLKLDDPSEQYDSYDGSGLELVHLSDVLDLFGK